MLELIVCVIVVMKVCEILGKLIPDSQTGSVATVRKFFKVIALYFNNTE